MDRMPIPRERSNSLSEQLSRRQRITDMEEGDTITPLMQVQYFCIWTSGRFSFCIDCPVGKVSLNEHW